MPRMLSFAIFFLVACVLVGGIHYYLWVRLVRDPQWPAFWHRALSVSLVVLALGVPLSMVLGRVLPRAITEVWLRPNFVWLGAMFLLLIAVLTVDLIRLAAVVAESIQVSEPTDPSRRTAVTRMFSLAAAGLGFGATAFALNEGFRFRVKRVEVELERLPTALDGTTVVQLSDVHVGPSIGKDFVAQVVSAVNQLEPDLVAITGDLVDGSVEKLASVVEPLRDIRSRYGKFFVTGNHEYYSGAEAWCNKLTELDFRVLRNERVSIGNGQASFDLAGVDDYSAHRFGNGHGANYQRAFQDRDPTRELVLLAHQPRAVYQAEKHGVGLQLSGHTHGGQVWPFSWLVKLQQPVVSGLERIGQTLVYVSNGTGYWGPPMRLGAPAEVTQIVLRSKQQKRAA